MAVNRYYSSTAIETVLSAPITDSATSIQVDSVAGFPATRPYTLSIDAENASKELVTVTNAAGTTLTVTRGVDGTSGVAHTLGAVVRHDHSARDFREPQEHIAATADVHGVTGALIGASTAAAFTNKDLTDASNTFPSSLATDAEIASAVAAEATLARNGTNITSGTVADARIASTIARDSEVASAVSTHAALTATHGVGEVVGRTETQTLTNKTLTSPVVTFPSCELTATAATSVPYATATKVTLDTSVFDAAHFSVAASVATATATGKYDISGLAGFAALSGTRSIVTIVKNGSTTIAVADAGDATNVWLAAPTALGVSLTAADTLQLQVYHTKGDTSAADTYDAAGFHARLYIRRVA